MRKTFYFPLCVAVVAAGNTFWQLAPASADQYIEETTRRTSTVETAPGTPAETTTIIERRSVVPGTPVPSGVVAVPTNTVLTSETKAVPIAVSDAQLILQTVEERRVVLDKSIADMIAAGTLTEVQATPYRTELDRINSEIVYLKGKPSVSRAIVVGQDLDALALRVRGNNSTLVYAPIIEGSHFTIVGGRIIQLDETAVRRVNLESKILDKQVQGKISGPESDALRQRLNEIAATEDAYRADGPLSDREARVIYKAMDKVAVQLERFER